MRSIQTYIDHFSECWNKSSTNLPQFSRVFTEAEKLEREKSYNNFRVKIKELQSKRKIQNIRSKPENTFFPMLKGFLQSVFDFDEKQLQIILSEEFKNVSKDFFYQARAFGPELKPEDIYQGLRNVWIMNGLQLIMKLPVRITPSVFAYSMIYPYSDNLLDDPNITDMQKKDFSLRFNDRLHGEKANPISNTEEQLFKLVGMFEEEYNRKEYPGVYESLYAIQQGQTNSLKLIGENNLTNSEIMNICFEKGGASVLADGYLVAGVLNEEEERALFGYGVYLQLLDDIQDIKEDADAKTNTMFSCLEKNDLGEAVNQTINFGRQVLDEMKCFPGTQDGGFLALMNRSIETMIIESVGLNEKWYTPEYLGILEQYSPLHFEFVRKSKDQSKSQRFSLFRKYFDQASPVTV